MEYTSGRQDSQPSRAGEGTFSGRAMLGPVLDDGDAGKVRVNTVVFEPGGRTHWHSHADGQVLFVGGGRGLVETRDGDRHALRPGDVVWAPPGEVHWHGAALTRSSFTRRSPSAPPNGARRCRPTATRQRSARNDGRPARGARGPLRAPREHPRRDLPQLSPVR